MTLVSKTPAPARGAQAPFVSAPGTASSAPELQATAPARAFDPDQRRKGLWRMAVLGALAVVFAVLLLVYDNPMEVGSDGFWRILQMRATTVGTIVVVAFCQAVATVIFHTATGNRILTPSIMGFDALYRVIQTALVFVFGAGALAATDGLPKVLVQSAIMIGFATLLYGWLFSGRFANLHIMLLIGVVLGAGFGSLATFMQRLLTPSEFDVLTARLFGNMSNSNEAYLPWAALLCVVVGTLVWRKRHQFDVIALGRDTAVNLGLNHRAEVIKTLVIVAVLISVSTSMVGPMTFFGFIVATISYQISKSQKHAYVLPTAALLGVVTLLGSYFILRHVFYAAGLVTVIIELAGGLFFLIYLLRKGSL